MTFKDYIARCKVPMDAGGDVLRLAKRDANLPEITTERELRAYLERRGLPESVVHGASRAWERYRTSMIKAGSG